jgi:ankyrin repeat protein
MNLMGLAIQCASGIGHPVCLCFPLSFKATAAYSDYPYTKDIFGQTPMHAAASSGNKAVTELLLAKNADVNSRDNDRITPLHRAALHGNKDVAKVLLINKAEVNAKANNGKTPLQLAKQEGNTNVAELLRQHGGHE